MEVTYKYGKTEKNNRGDVEKLIEDLSSKDGFKSFLNDNRLICISNEFSNNNTLLNLEFNYDLEETKEPNGEVLKIRGFLENVFGLDSFNMEMIPNGCRLISNFMYSKINTMEKTKHVLSNALTRFKNLDLNASFTINPIPRIGYDKITGFLYSPTDELNEKYRNSLFGTHTDFFSEEFWESYIQNNLIPYKADRMNMSTLYEKLEQVNRLIGGDILDEEEIKELERKNNGKTEL